MDDNKLKQAHNLMNSLGNENQSLMGLSQRKEGIFDTLLWLIGEGEPLDELQDLEE